MSLGYLICIWMEGGGEGGSDGKSSGSENESQLFESAMRDEFITIYR